MATLLPSLLGDVAAPFLHDRDVILFQGDSITDGGRWRSISDFNHSMGQDYAYILAAEIGASHPELNLTFLNRGISGNRVPDLLERWQSDTLDLKPNVVSILVGINDTLMPGETAEQYRARYDGLLSKTVAALPTTKIILGEPFLLPVGKYQESYSSQIIEVRKRQTITRDLARKYHAVFVPYQDAFDAACKTAPADRWSWDGVHPTYAGHGLMAREWLRAIAGGS